MTPGILKRQALIEDTEHEEADDRHETSPCRREQIDEATSDFSAVFLNQTALRSTDVHGEGASLGHSDDCFDFRGVEA